MNVKTEFEMALMRCDFESSDTKAQIWKRLKQDREAFALIVLAMEFTFELGYQECETND